MNTVNHLTKCITQQLFNGIYVRPSTFSEGLIFESEYVAYYYRRIVLV